MSDKTEVNIGDRIKVEVFSTPGKGIEMVFPESPAQLGDFSFISSEPVKKTFFGKKREGRIYTYTIYKTGTHVISPMEILYKSPGESDWKSILSSQVPIEVKSLLDPETQDIRDIKGVFSRSRRIGGFIASLFALAALIAAGIWIRRRRLKAREEAAARTKPAHEVAYDRLRQLKAMRLAEKGFIKEYYIKLSEIVRYYIEDRFSFRAPEMTTEEFLESLRESPKLKIEHKQLLREFLSQCDMVKFAKYGPTPLEVLDSFSSAERLVDQTIPEEGGEAE